LAGFQLPGSLWPVHFFNPEPYERSQQDSPARDLKLAIAGDPSKSPRFNFGATPRRFLMTHPQLQQCVGAPGVPSPRSRYKMAAGEGSC